MTASPVDLTVQCETFPVAGAFTISRGSRTEIHVVTATISDGTHTGRGECVPYPRYGESVAGVAAALEAMGPILRSAGADRIALQTLMPSGAARNALDCALWDLEAKQTGKRAWELAGLKQAQPVVTAYTISLGTPAAMAEAAAAAADRPLLKVKLGGEGDAERIAAIRAAAPDSDLIVDANEAWAPEHVEDLLSACADVGVVLVEQPLPSNDDGMLADIERPVPVCADESAHDRNGLHKLVGRYDAINIKLDKTGGLTEALALAEDARDLGLTIMVGCMLGTSLAMAPALLVAQSADIVDLDGPLLLAEDRTPGLTYRGSTIEPAPARLWG